MDLKSEHELVNTKRKLRLVEESYAKAEADTEDEELREMELESLMRLINQLKEEIARYEAHRSARREVLG